MTRSIKNAVMIAIALCVTVQDALGDVEEAPLATGLVCYPNASVDERTNPRGMVISNTRVVDALHQLTAEIEKLLGHSEFSILPTGGDRYRNHSGEVRSCTDHSFVKYSARLSQHLSKEAVDVQISGVPQAIIDKARLNTDFAAGYYSNNYSDGHHHFSLRRGTWDEAAYGL